MVDFDFRKEHAVETFKSLIEISLAGLKLLALFNGGAAVALLAYLGNVAGKGLPVPRMHFPMSCYVVGLFCCGLAYLSGYMTQAVLYGEIVEREPEGSHVKYQVAGVITAAASLVAFVWGSLAAVLRF